MNGVQQMPMQARRFMQPDINLISLDCIPDCLKLIGMHDSRGFVIKFIATIKTFNFFHLSNLTFRL